jgi:asparagine synthase (glutamine-hydrolysing)
VTERCAKMAPVCGIGAILDPSDTAPSDAGRRMTAALRHRGPDGDGVRRVGACTLAHTRLAIIDVSGGDQPLSSEDGQVTAIVNGEIYNHHEVRATLERSGHRFATHSDSEVVVHAYEEHGPDLVRHLNGIFAFALWDERSKRLVAARDHFGVKPLYWCTRGDRLALASEVGALLASGLAEARIDRSALDHFLTCGFVPAPRTLFEGVSKLPAASLLVAEEGAVPRVTSFRDRPGAPITDLAGEELAGQLAERFTDAVERQMMSDVPYGAFLSGGVDSAAIVAAMGKRSPDRPSTFTIGFPGHGDVLDERRYAARTASALGTDHHETAQEDADFVDDVRRCVRSLEEPCGLPSAAALMALSRFAAGSVKVVLSGQGADEPHGGYARHQAAALVGPAGRLGPMAGPLRSVAQRFANEYARRAAGILADATPAERLLSLAETTDERVRSSLVGAPAAGAAAERRELAEGVLADVGDRGLVEQALYLDTHLFLPDRLLLCADKMSMAASLEQRVPFLDVELMRFVERIPARERVRPRQGKRLHRRAMARLVPAEIANRPKHGFSSPVENWLRGSLGGEVESRYTAGSPVSELIDPSAVARLVAEHRDGKANRKRILYCLLELSDWHRIFIEGDVPAPAAAGAA